MPKGINLDVATGNVTSIPVSPALLWMNSTPTWTSQSQFLLLLAILTDTVYEILKQYQVYSNNAYNSTWETRGLFSVVFPAPTSGNIWQPWNNCISNKSLVMKNTFNMIFIWHLIQLHICFREMLFNSVGVI